MIWGSCISAAAVTHALACHFTVSILSQIGGLGLSHFAPRQAPASITNRIHSSNHPESHLDG